MVETKASDALVNDTADEAIKKELLSLDIVLSAKVAKTALTLDEYIQFRVVQGATLQAIRADLLTDLEEGGRIFGEFFNTLKPTFAGSTSRFRDTGILAEVGVSKVYRWVAVLVNTCPDCLERHGQEKDWSAWEDEGLPRSGATVCGQNCKCILLPKEIIALEPVYRKGG